MRPPKAEAPGSRGWNIPEWQGNAQLCGWNWRTLVAPPGGDS